MDNHLYPCLWFDQNAEEAARFYAETFQGSVSGHGTSVFAEVFGQKLMLLNGGPHFKKNASISFMVLCSTAEEVERYWEALSAGGIVLMPLDSYPWSSCYGWVRDRYGVTWQVNLTDRQVSQRLVPTLMFIHQNNGKAREAMAFYTSIFPDSSIGDILLYGQGVGGETHEVPENIQHADFMLNGYLLFCMDNSYDHPFDFNEGISMVVMTDSQEETDRYWDALTSGGTPGRCGWLKDRYGVSWQVVPRRVAELMNNRTTAPGAVKALMTMQKIVISELERAAYL